MLEGRAGADAARGDARSVCGGEPRERLGPAAVATRLVRAIEVMAHWAALGAPASASSAASVRNDDGSASSEIEAPVATSTSNSCEPADILHDLLP